MVFDGLEVQPLLGMHVSFAAPLNGNNGPVSSLVGITVDGFNKVTIPR